jgi:hypothetical protein
LFCRPSANLGESDVEKQPFMQEHDQALQQRLVGLRRSSLEGRIGERVDERDQELVLVADRGDLVVALKSSPS